MGKNGKGNPKDDFENTVLNVFAAVRKAALLNLEHGAAGGIVSLRPGVFHLGEIRMCVMCVLKVTAALAICGSSFSNPIFDVCPLCLCLPVFIDGRGGVVRGVYLC